MQNLKNKIISVLGPIYPILVSFLICLLILSISRACLTLVYLERLINTEEFLWLFPIGIRMDTVISCYLLTAPLIFIFLATKNFALRFKSFFVFWNVLSILILTFLEIATFQFIEEYDLRPDRKFFEYLGHVNEVFNTLWKAYKVHLLLAITCTITLGFFLTKLFKKLIVTYDAWNIKKRLIVFPFMVLLFILGCRSSIGHRPINISATFFSDNHLANELALNSTYSLFYAIYRTVWSEKNPSYFYGKITGEEAISILKPLIEQSQNQYIKSEIPFMHVQKSPFKKNGPKNIVMIILESVGSTDTGCLGGPNITPNLCKLKDKGLWLSNLHATGTRTARGLEALVTGFLPTPGASVLKLSQAKNNFFSIAQLLKENGYDTSFVYGGMSNFDQMRSFFMANGFNDIYDQNDYENPVFTTTWGVSDEDLFRKANEIYSKQTDKPFFSLILTTSNHVPYEFPDGRINLYEQPKETHFNTVKYTDYALGLFFKLAEKEAYYKDTIFIVAADHNHHVEGNDLFPVTKYHIPALILGANVPQKEIKTLASQIDIIPTALHFSGIDTIHPMIGKNLMYEDSESSDGRAIMHFGDNIAFRKNNLVVVLRPLIEAKQFQLIEDSLVSMNLDQEIFREALAYSYLPWHLYSKKLYRLK